MNFQKDFDLMRASRTTIFKQLIINVITPVVISLLALAFLNHQHNKKLLEDSNHEKNVIISDEIQNILKFQDLALNILEDPLNTRMKIFSDRINSIYLKEPGTIEDIDLNELAVELGMNPDLEDIYIVNERGIIVNTTFKKDLHLNLYSFGKEHQDFLESVRLGNSFRTESFSIESSTKRLKKYSYEPTYDHKYIIELGIYSKGADDIITSIKDRLNKIAQTQQSIESIDLFIGAEHPFSLNKDAELDEKHLSILAEVFKLKTSKVKSEEEQGKSLDYEYVYFERENTDLYKESVIRIVADRSGEIAMLRMELFKSLGIFLIVLIVVIYMVYSKTKVITNPIKSLVENVVRITDGHLNERAEVIGNNEITSLSEKFNLMIGELQSYYTDLEQKVKERTAEISKQKEEIELQKDALADKNKEIMDSIHYAKRIQNAILPPPKYVNDVMPNSFILYKPKDIVSGDFYWVNKKENTLMFAAVDCTGHGVPGAFMSIVGNNQLNYTVNVKNSRTSNDILNGLNKGVTQSLRQTMGGTSVKDGMDIALCCIDTNTQKVQFSGANNPIYLIRNGELIETKGDKHPIGAFLGEDLKAFTPHEFTMEKRDTIYVFSDGYPDQFGGPKGKKFKYKQFKELLLRINDKSMKEQKEILNTEIENWRGDVEQIDDILIIGYRFE